MTSLADIALAFARECLGWKDAKDGNALGPFVWSPPYNSGKELWYNSLDKILEAVRRWCDSHDAAMELAYHGFLTGEWEARVATPVSVEEMVHGDLCHALLAACVEAARKLKAVNAPR